MTETSPSPLNAAAYDEEEADAEIILSSAHLKESGDIIIFDML